MRLRELTVLTSVLMWVGACVESEPKLDHTSNEAIAVEASCTNTNEVTAANALACDLTVGADADIVLITAHLTSRVTSVATASVGGQAATRLGREIHSGEAIGVEIWYLVNPPAGTQAVQITLSANDKWALGAVSLTGVNQAAPFGANSSSSCAAGDIWCANGHGAMIAKDVVCGAGDAVFAAAHTDDEADTTSLSIGPGPTPVYAISMANSEPIDASATLAPCSSSPVASSWDVIGGPISWVAAAVPLQPAASSSCTEADPGDSNYCAVCGPCAEGEGDCDNSGECAASLQCVQQSGTDYCEASCPLDPGHMDYCNACGPCAEGEGDCDNDGHCESGLVCVQQSGIDYCQIPSCGADPGDSDYCNVCGPCAEGEGDCDNDSHCESGLVCVQQSGIDYCQSPSCGADPGDSNYCAVCGPCAEGEGDCDNDNECATGLVCVQQSGIDYCQSPGCPASPDDEDYCTVCGPCAEGEGDCDSDAECAAGLVCSEQGAVNRCTNPSCGANPGDSNYCTVCGPCTDGQGDCDNDGECAAGLVCNEQGAIDTCGSPGCPPGATCRRPVATTTPAFPGQTAFDGYYAQYEIDIGQVPTCDDVVNDSYSASAINNVLNNSNRTTCFSPGVYTGKYIINNTSGTASSRKWVRPSTSGTTHPYHLSAGAQVIFTRSIEMNDSDHWVFYRTTHDLNMADDEWFDLDGSRFNVFDRIVGTNIGTHEGSQQTGVKFDYNSTDNTIQNSVFHTSEVVDDAAVLVVSIKDRTRLINNEMFNIMEGFGQPQKSSTGGANGEDAIVENNDFYYTPAWYTDCAGHWDVNGSCMAAEGSFDLKSGGTAGAPMRFIHNRFWGTRKSDSSICCTSGGRGHAIVIIADDPGNIAKYIEIRDNVFMDSARGVFDTNNGGDSIDHISLVGNLFYLFPDRDVKTNYCFGLDETDDSEIYFNTCITAQYGADSSSNARDIDAQCNTFIDANSITGGVSSDSFWDFNAFFNTDLFTTESPGHNLVFAAAGQAASDQLCFRRRQWTAPGGEEVCIPHARPTPSSPHYLQCADRAIGTTSGIGIDDALIESRGPYWP